MYAVSLTFLYNFNDVICIKAELIRVLGVVCIKSFTLRDLGLGFGGGFGTAASWRRPVGGLPVSTWRKAQDFNRTGGILSIL